MDRDFNKKISFYLIYFIIVILILIVILYVIMRGSDRKQEITRIDLWNGMNISEWVLFTGDSTALKDTVFYVKDDVIRIGGQPFGYMRTKVEYAGYHLHVDWRWPEQAGNSGVFLNISGQDKQWPATIECQLMSGNAGDFVFLGGSDATERTDKTKMVKPKIEISSEKPAGDWNSYDIYSRNDSIIVYVNNVLQNLCSHPTPDKGYIGLQSEGAPVEFRNVWLEYLPAISTPDK
jgi:3-keto-disaccharide hydrolase